MSEKLLLEGFVGKNDWSFRHVEYDDVGAFIDGNRVITIAPDTFQDIEEHALTKRGLWEADDGCLIRALPDSPECALVITPDNVAVWIERKDLQPGGKYYPPLTRQAFMAAVEYFKAHPAKKPWHSANYGEVWAVTINNETHRMVVNNGAAGYGLFFTDIMGFEDDVSIDDASIQDAKLLLSAEENNG